MEDLLREDNYIEVLTVRDDEFGPSVGLSVFCHVRKVEDDWITVDGIRARDGGRLQRSTVEPIERSRILKARLITAEKFRFMINEWESQQ